MANVPLLTTVPADGAFVWISMIISALWAFWRRFRSRFGRFSSSKSFARFRFGRVWRIVTNAVKASILKVFNYRLNNLLPKLDVILDCVTKQVIISFNGFPKRRKHRCMFFREFVEKHKARVSPRVESTKRMESIDKIFEARDKLKVVA